jgi:multiple sugar transport system substrate-binding protein
MAELLLTLAGHSDEEMAAFQGILQQFKQSYRHTVHVESFPWTTIWNELAQIAIHKRGPDVSELGSSWIGSLVEMEALRPLSRVQVASMGGRSAFIPAAWTPASLIGGDQVWSIPFLGDVRVIYYWKDMFEQAGIVDGQNAFRTFERVKDTLELLRRVIPTPWGAGTATDRNQIYYIASWIWGAGGDFVSPDGQTVTINHPAALAGIKEFFDLYRFMPQEGQPFQAGDVIKLFAERKIAAMISGTWFLRTLSGYGVTPDMLSQVGMALPPGSPYVGGTHFGIWQHSIREREALDLVRFTTLTSNQVLFCQLSGMLPVRVSALDVTPFSTDAHYRVFADALRVGRALTPVTLWGMMEEKLIAALGDIWAEITKQPGGSVEEILHDILDPLANRLQKVIIPK